MAGVRDYFSFSRRERTGAIVLIILIGIVFMLPEWIPGPATTIDAASSAEIRKQIDALKRVETDALAGASSINLNEDYLAQSESSYKSQQKTLLFNFDPNTLQEDGWKKLGVNERTIKTIQNYISKGGRFRQPEDISRIYGLKKDQYERLLPFVRIKRDYEKDRVGDSVYSKPRSYNKTPAYSPVVIDINEADTSMLIALPGIGAKLANRIVNFRDKLGGFYSIDQIRETYGLPDSTFQKIKPFLNCNKFGIQQMNINTVDEATLKLHPYFRWNIANAIVSYRQQHGNYSAIEDLLKIDIITSEILQKLAPYLKID
jgi:competence protein ComEA